jgi:hypothetical protein
VPIRVAAVVSISALAILVLVFMAVAPEERVRAQSECPSPQLIDTVTGSGDQQSPPFTTTTNSFRLSYQTTADDPNAPFLANVENADPNQDPIGPAGNISRTGSANGETFANVPPGRYALQIFTTGGTQYTVKIEECGEGGQANPNEGTSGAGPTTTGSTTPKTTPAQPKTASSPQSSPQPKSSSPPSPPSSVPQGQLMNAGGPTDGPVPQMPEGGCPQEFPKQHRGACFRQ